MNDQIKKNKRKVALFLAYKTFSSDYLFFFAVDTLYFSEIKSMSFSSISLLITIFALCYIIFSIPMVRIVRKIGTANASRIGTIMYLVSAVLLFFEPWTIYISKVFYAFGLSMCHVSEPKLLKDNLKMYGFNENYSKYNAISKFTFAMLSGGACISAGFLFNIYPYAPIICCIGFLFIGCILSIFIKNEKEIYKKQNHLPPHSTKIEKFEYFKLFKYHTTWLLLFFSMLCFGLIAGATDLNNMSLQDAGFSAIVITIIAGIARFARAFIVLGFGFIYKKMKFSSIYLVIPLVIIGLLCMGLGGLLLKDIAAIIVMGIGSSLLFACTELYDVVRVDFIMNSQGLTKRQSLLTISNIGNYSGRLIVSLALSGILLSQSAIMSNLILLGALMPLIIVVSLLLSRKRKINRY